MPVFGKGRTHRTKHPARKRYEERIQNTLVFRLPFSRKRLFTPREPRWGTTDTSFKSLQKGFPLLFGSSARTAKARSTASDLVTQRYRKTQRPQVIVDWGCGEGRTILELQKHYGSKVNGYGYSEESFSNWNKKPRFGKTPTPKQVKLIQGTAGDFFRYFKDNSIDILYSELGLRYVFTPERPKVRPVTNISRGVRYIERLFKKISPGGVLSFELVGHLVDPTLIQLQSRLSGKALVFSPDQTTLHIQKNEKPPRKA